MGLETGTYIDSLNASWPIGATDKKQEGDDHFRLIKSTIKNTFPNLTGAMTATQVELNILDGATLTTAELNILTGATLSTAELNILAGATLTTAEINILTGATLSTTELNYVTGVTSSLQAQLNAKQPLDADLTAIAALANTNSNFIVGNGTAWVTESGNTARTSLGLGTTDNVIHNNITGNNIIGNDVTVNGAFTSLGIDDNAPATALILDSTGNMGLGVTPDAVGSAYTNLQIGAFAYNIAHSGGDHYLTNNAYQNAGWKYGQTSSAQRIQMASGAIKFDVAASGTAGTAISFTTALTIDTSGNATFGGNILQGDNDYHYWGASNDFSIRHNATNTELLNNTGSLLIVNKVNSGIFNLSTFNSVGVEKLVVSINGNVPKVDFHYNGIKEGETLSGSLDGTNDLTIGGSTKIGKESKIDWANYNGVTQMSVEKGGTSSSTAVLTTDYITIFIPASASTLRYAAEMSCDTDGTRETYVALISATKSGTECSQTGSSSAPRTFPTNNVQEGTLDVSDQQGNFIRLDVSQRNNSTGGGSHTGVVYNFSMYFE